MKERQRLKIDISKAAFAILTVSMMGLFATSSVSLAFADNATTFSGRATAVSVHTSLAGLVLADTGDLPSSGGTKDATVLTVNDPLVHADVLLSVTNGFDNTASSTTALADIVLLPGSSTPVTADFLRSHTEVSCTGASASSEIVNLQIAGIPVVVSAPNTVVTIPLVGTLTIDSQTTSQGSTNSATAIGLDLKLFTGDEVIVSFAHSDITCGTSTEVVKDFMTAGGFILVNGVKVHFGFVVGFKPQATTLDGRVHFIDEAKNHLTASNVDSYSGTGLCRIFSGSGTINGQSVNFTIDACDHGEPGKGSDTFSIRMSNEYKGLLSGGNIQLHT